MLYRFSAGISYYCYLFTFLLVYIVLILDCVGYFHRPKKPLIQSRYTLISECFLLARLRRRINGVLLQNIVSAKYIVCTHWLNIVGAPAPTTPMIPTPMARDYQILSSARGKMQHLRLCADIGMGIPV